MASFRSAGWRAARRARVRSTRPPWGWRGTGGMRLARGAATSVAQHAFSRSGSLRAHDGPPPPAVPGRPPAGPAGPPHRPPQPQRRGVRRAPGRGGRRRRGARRALLGADVPGLLPAGPPARGASRRRVSAGHRLPAGATARCSRPRITASPTAPTPSTCSRTSGRSRPRRFEESRRRDLRRCRKPGGDRRHAGPGAVPRGWLGSLHLGQERVRLGTTARPGISARSSVVSRIRAGSSSPA